MEPKKKRRINPETFLFEYTRGLSDDELKQRFTISQSQLVRIIELLRVQGRITSEILSQRENNIRIRFGTPVDGQDKRSAVDLDTGLVLHCPSCGAAVKRGSENCDYCNAHLDFSLEGKTVLCPSCFGTTPAEGKFCFRCAAPISGRIKKGLVLSDKLCPRCTLPMRGAQLGDFSLMECEQCNGVFVPHEIFEMMQAHADKLIFPTGNLKRNQPELPAKVHYVRCPECRSMMNRSNFARISGVIVDICSKHGIWFEKGEIARIMEFIRNGGIEKAKQTELQRIKDEEKLAQIRGMQVNSSSEYRHALPHDPFDSADSFTRLIKLVFGD